MERELEILRKNTSLTVGQKYTYIYSRVFLYSQDLTNMFSNLIKIDNSG